VVSIGRLGRVQNVVPRRYHQSFSKLHFSFHFNCGLDGLSANDCFLSRPTDGDRPRDLDLAAGTVNNLCASTKLISRPVGACRITATLSTGGDGTLAAPEGAVPSICCISLVGGDVGCIIIVTLSRIGGDWPGCKRTLSVLFLRLRSATGDADRLTERGRSLPAGEADRECIDAVRVGDAGRDSDPTSCTAFVDGSRLGGLTVGAICKKPMSETPGADATE